MNFEILMQFLLAALWGGIIGLEREYRSKAAGFRTMIMISIGSCFFTKMSLLLGAPNSPDRIASNIVTGIGFLGAGVIFRQANHASGITTAATIWAVAAVGMGIGGGHYTNSAIASSIILLVLTILPAVERYVVRFNQIREYTISYNAENLLKVDYETLFDQNNLKRKVISELKEGNLLQVTWEAIGHEKDHAQFISSCMSDARLLRFEY
ncbi:MAG: MgtC/SapB family protein [Bacteroidetes bacterium]|nr:MgtC/SapB family protein [Bacteroidota bacterium]